MPHGVQTKGVHRFVRAISGSLTRNITFFDTSIVLTIKRKASSKEVDSEREAIVVDQTSVDGKETHHGNHVTTSVHAFTHFTKLGIVVGLFVPQEIATREEEEQTVTDISVHHPKQERECGSSEESRVGLPITGDSISVYKFLVAVGELVGSKVSGGSRPWLGHMVHQGRHGQVHVGVSTFHSLADGIKGFRNNPTFSSEHSRDIRLEHVEGVVDSLFAEHNPSPTFSVLGQELAETVAGVLIFQQDSAAIDQFLSIFSQHGIHGRGIVHVRKRVSVSRESIADLLELGFNGLRLVEDDEDRFFYHDSSFRVGDGLLDGSKAHIAVTTSGAEDHALKSNTFFGRDNTSDTREAHVQIRANFGFQKTGGISSFAGSAGQFRNSQARSIGHEKAAGLFQHFLQFDLFVVFLGELLGVVVQFTKLRFILIQFSFHGLQELGTTALGSIGSSGDKRRRVDKVINSSGRHHFQFKLFNFVSKVAKLAF